MVLDDDLLRVLACPVCRAPVTPLPGAEGLRCDDCGRVYPIRDGIPMMTAEESCRAPATDGNR